MDEGFGDLIFLGIPLIKGVASGVILALGLNCLSRGTELLPHLDDFCPSGRLIVCRAGT